MGLIRFAVHHHNLYLKMLYFYKYYNYSFFFFFYETFCLYRSDLDIVCVCVFACRAVGRCFCVRAVSTSLFLTCSAQIFSSSILNMGVPYAGLVSATPPLLPVGLISCRFPQSCMIPAEHCYGHMCMCMYETGTWSCIPQQHEGNLAGGQDPC